MNSSRRELLKAAGLGGTALALGGCDGFYRAISRELGSSLPETMSVPQGEAIDEAHHFLSRAAFGPWPGDRDRVRKMGISAAIEEQLAPHTIDDAACTILARRFESLHLKAGDMYEFKRPVIREELSRATLLRAIYSRRQLLEVMVNFWSDHFNIFIEKGDCAWLKAADDRDVIRRHALGNMRDLLKASALSPAMLVYLDGTENRKVNPGDQPNENYARELLELHTLGVHGGYTQKDVMEVARCLTGWTVRTGWNKGTVEFRQAAHDDGPKRILGIEVPAGLGERDLDKVLDIVTLHPSTARALSGKLCRRFVSDPPPEALVERVAKTYIREEGEIRPVLKTLLHSEEFRQARGVRVKRPFRFVVSALRAVGADTDAGPPILRALTRMGQAPFQYPTPDGYPDESYSWLGTLLWRWNFALALAENRIKGTRMSPDALAGSLGSDEPRSVIAHLFGRIPNDMETEAITGSPEQVVGLALASPAFQRH